MIKGKNQKNRSKRGMFNISTKTAYQKQFKELEKQRIKKKKEEGKKLTPREEKFIKSVSVTRSKFSPKLGVGKPVHKEEVVQIKDLKNLGNIDVAISSRQKIALSSLLQKRNNVYSMHDVNKLLGEFVNILKNVPGVTSVKVEGTKQNPRIRIVKDYQETVMDFNPKNVTLLAEEWKLKLPDNLIKIDETHYKAPEQQFRSYHYYYHSGGTNERRDEYSMYSPLYIELYNPNKIKLIKKFGIIEYFDKKYRSSDIYKHEEKSKPFLSALREFYKTGIIKNIKNYGVYEKSESEDKDTATVNVLNRDVYLQKNVNVNERGNITKQEEYDIYENKYKYQKNSDGERSSDRYHTPYKKREIIFDDNVQIKLLREWSPFTVLKTEYNNDQGEKEEERTKEVYLKHKQEYEGGKLKQEENYNSYLSYISGNWGPTFFRGRKEYDTYLEEKKRYAEDKLLEYQKNKVYERASYERDQDNGYGSGWTDYAVMPELIIKKDLNEEIPRYNIKRFSIALTKYYNDYRRKIEERRTRMIEKREGKEISKPSSYYYINPQLVGERYREYKPYLLEKGKYNPLKNKFSNVKVYESPYKTLFKLSYMPVLIGLKIEKQDLNPKKYKIYKVSEIGNYQTIQPTILEQVYQKETQQSKMYSKVL